MNRFFLHVGLPKTGTSTLQRALFAHHSQIYYLGKLVGNGAGRKHCRDMEVQKLLEPLLWNLDQPFHIAATRERYTRTVLDNAAVGQLVVASWEALGKSSPAGFRKMLTRVKSVIDDFGLLFVLRNPLTWAPSQYLQSVQGNYVKNNRGRFASKPYLSLESWMASHASRTGHLGEWLCHSSNIQIALSLLGRENVGVFLYEELCGQPDAYFTSLARFLGIDVQESLRLALGSHFNTRLLQAELDYIEQVSNSLPGRIRWRFSQPVQRRRAMKAYLARQGHPTQPARIQLTEEWQERVSEATRAGNQWLASELGLNLAAHGYPI